MDINLDDCTLINLEEYLNLKDPQFVGQTRLSPTGMYYMVWSDEGKLYKTINHL